MAERQAHRRSGASAALSGEALGDRPGPGSVWVKVLSPWEIHAMAESRSS